MSGAPRRPGGFGYDSRSGAHRARGSLASAVYPVALVVVVVALVVAFLLYLLHATAPAVDSAREAARNGQTMGALTTPGSGATSGPSAQTGSPGSPSRSSTPTPSSATPTAPSGPVNKSVPVVVSNGTGLSGLARQTTQRLASAGWTAASAGADDAREPSRTTIAYAAPDLRGTAQSLASTLGAGSAVRSSDAPPGGLKVVLGADFHG